MRITSNKLSGAGSDELFVIRGALGTASVAHVAGSFIKKIEPKAIEFRRPSIIRASGHTFEYIGYGPGNYSTGIPQVQVKTLTEDEDYLAQAQERDCGTVVYTGMNSKGDFIIGNKKINSSTGQEKTFDIPVPTVTGQDPARLSVVFDEVVIKERLLVEGGKSKTILSEFDGPVNFSQSIKVKGDLTVAGATKYNKVVEILDTNTSFNCDTGALVVKGGAGIKENLNICGNFQASGIGTFGKTLNITSGGVIMEAGSANQGYRIDSGNNIDMSLYRSTVSGLPIVLKVRDGKRLVIGENGDGLVEIRDSVNGTLRAQFTPNEQELYFNGSEKFRTETSGVRITGIATVTSDLHVDGTTSSTSTTTGSGIFDGGVGIAQNLNVGGSSALGGNVNITGNITASGVLDINGTGTHQLAGPLEVSGSIKALNADIIAFATSDENLKDNITPIENPIAKLLQLSGNTFNWNEKSEYEGKADTGVIAQEVEKLGLPDVVATRDDGTKAVRYEKLIPLLIEAIKELNAKVDDLS